MSLFCFCVVSNYAKNKIFEDFCQNLSAKSKYYDVSLNSYVDWDEPILSVIDENSYVISISDLGLTNCELFLLPDNWYYNGKTNEKSFKERIIFLKEITNYANEFNYKVDFFIGESGTMVNEYQNYLIPNCLLMDFFCHTLGVDGVSDGIHVKVI